MRFSAYLPVFNVSYIFNAKSAFFAIHFFKFDAIFAERAQIHFLPRARKASADI